MKKVYFIYLMIACVLTVNAQENEQMIFDFNSETVGDASDLWIFVGAQNDETREVSYAVDPFDSNNMCLKTSVKINDAKNVGLITDSVITKAIVITEDGKSIITCRYIRTGGGGLFRGWLTDNLTDGTPAQVVRPFRFNNTTIGARDTTDWAEVYIDWTALATAKDNNWGKLWFQLDFQSPHSGDFDFYIDDIVIPVAVTSTSVKTNLLKDLIVRTYPNRITFQGNVNVKQAKVYDISGRMIKVVSNSNIKEIPMTNFKNGIYLIVVKTDKGNGTYKVFKF